jgi:preprotein translocase subunit SecD
MRNIRNRLLVILGLVIVSVYALIPKTGPTGEKVPAINLGLDLQGGMHLAVEVDDPDGTLTSEAQADALERTLTTIRNRIDEFGVREPTIQRVGNERIIVELAGIDDPERAKSIVERTAFLEFKLVREDDNFRNALPRIDRGIVQELGAENLRGAAIEEVELETPALTDILGTQSDSADVAQGDTLSTQSDAAPDSTDSAESDSDSDTASCSWPRRKCPRPSGTSRPKRSGTDSRETPSSVGEPRPGRPPERRTASCTCSRRTRS